MPTALVTGAAGAFGSAVVHALRDRGWSVVTTDVAGDVDVRADLADDSCVTALRSAAGGRLDLLVYCAGVGLPTDVGAPPDAAVRTTIEVNLLGAWRAVGACMPALLAGRGRIVLVASGLAYVSVPFAGAYAVSKRALSAYADQVRVEYGTHVSVTTVYPGYVKTPIHDEAAKAGLSFAGTVYEESVSDVVRTVISAVEAKRAPRDVGTTWKTTTGVWIARRTPKLLDRAVGVGVRRLVRRGTFSEAPSATAFVRRLRDR